MAEHWETTYVFDPVSGTNKPKRVWVEDKPIPEEKEVSDHLSWSKFEKEGYIDLYETRQEALVAYKEYRETGTLPTSTAPVTEEEEVEEEVTPPTMPPFMPSIPSPEVPPLIMPKIKMPSPPTPPPLPEVPEVPPYEKSPEQIAWEEEYGEELRKWREAGGYGIPEDIQTKMIQKQTDILKARETENIRIMQNNMERRGITNSGFVFANEQTIRSSTTVAIANNIRDVQISSALMKMASFEKSMGATAQFVGYLAQESAKTYMPKIAQWEMEAKYRLAGYGVAAQYGLAGYEAQVKGAIAQFQANVMGVMAEWQAKFDLIKMELNQAYAQNNINLANEWAAILQDDQQEHEVELEEIKAEAANQAAAAQGFWGAIGTTAGILL